MRKLIVNRTEAKVILEKDQFTFVRKVYPRSRTGEEAVKKTYFVGARFWVAEPVCYIDSPVVLCGGKKVFSVDPIPKDWARVTGDRPGYRIDQRESRHVVEVVSVEDKIVQQKWASVVHVGVTFKKVEK